MMTGLMSPLSPTSANMLSRTPSSFSERMKQSTASATSNDNNNNNNNNNTTSPTFPDHAQLPDIPPSSPFQPEVAADNMTFSPGPAASPSRFYTAKQTRKSPTKPFDIHCDDLYMDMDTVSKVEMDGDGFAIPALPLRRASEDTVRGYDLSLQDIEIPPTSKADEFDDFDDDLSLCDAPTVVSEDTCFSTFSAVPNADMTLFANLGGNRTSNHMMTEMTPRGPSSRTPATNRKQSAAPTPASAPHRKRSPSNDTTSLLLDFTQQFEGSTRSARPSPTKTSSESHLRSYLNNQRSPGKPKPATPSKRASVLNLLDFDLPPQATPRSVPSITARELETLKSSYLSEISSLKATLSGREAEVESLKKAVGDAERRVGEALEEVREERSAREHADGEKLGWEKKGRELEHVMKTLKDEFLALEKDREDLQQKVDDSKQDLEVATKAKQEAENKSLELAAKLANGASSSDAGSAAGDDAIEALVSQRVSQQLDEKMEGLARELHAVYKKKHETKVATLKKTYEARGEKKCAELQQKLDTLTKQHEDFLANASSSSTSSSVAADTQLLLTQRAEIQEHTARIAGLMRQLDTLSQTQSAILSDLERERTEKGELVAAVDEMLALQADMTAASGMQTPARAGRVISGIEDFRKSISRPTPMALKGPGLAGGGGGGGESRIGRFGAPAAQVRAAGGPSKSRMMSNIERMGGKSGLE